MAEPFLSEIRLFGINFAPRGWALCDGQLLPINQNQPLFALLGTTYGGDGQTTFGLPDLRGRVPLGLGGGYEVSPGNRAPTSLGQKLGEESHTVIQSEMPIHNHAMLADGNTAATTNVASPGGNMLGKAAGSQSPGGAFTIQTYGSGSPGGTLVPTSIGNNGGSQSHENRQPFLAITFCIALQGIFPSQN